MTRRRRPATGELVATTEFVSPPTVAAWLGIAVPALIAGAEQGLLPAIREGGRWRFHGPTVRAWMETDAAPQARLRLLGRS